MSSAAVAPASSKLIAVPLVKQRETNWCWAACCEAFTAHYKAKIKTKDEFVLLIGTRSFQEKAAERAHSGTDRELNSTAQPSEYVSLLKQVLGAEINVHFYVGSAVDAHYSKDSIKKALDDDRIFILNARNHSRVLCGYGPKPKGTEEGLFFMDPAVGAYAWESWDTYLVNSVSMIWVKKGGLV